MLVQLGGECEVRNEITGISRRKGRGQTLKCLEGFQVKMVAVAMQSENKG